MALECLLNINFNKQNESLPADWYKNELRELFVLEKLLILLKCMLNQFQKEKEKSSASILNPALLNKYAKYINLIITVTQHPIALNSPAKSSQHEATDCESKRVEESASTLNQNYLIEYQNNFLLELLNESLCLFYSELEKLSKATMNSTNQTILKNSITNSIKQTFLVMINLTHKNCKFFLILKLNLIQICF